MNNKISALNTRIDHNFMRSPDGDGSLLNNANVRAWTLGDKPQDKTLEGLWPSDHAGVTANVRFVRPKHVHHH